MVGGEGGGVQCWAGGDVGGDGIGVWGFEDAECAGKEGGVRANAEWEKWEQIEWSPWGGNRCRVDATPYFTSNTASVTQHRPSRAPEAVIRDIALHPWVKDAVEEHVRKRHLGRYGADV